MRRKIPAKIEVIDGKAKPILTTYNRKNLDNLMLTLADKNVWISIEKQTKNRSIPQNSYLWGVVYKIICEHTGDDDESFHHWARGKFLSVTGGAVPKIKSTTKLSPKEFMEYVDKIIKWAAEFDGIYIPFPNEEELWGSVLNDNA